VQEKFLLYKAFVKGNGGVGIRQREKFERRSLRVNVFWKYVPMLLWAFLLGERVPFLFESGFLAKPLFLLMCCCNAKKEGL